MDSTALSTTTNKNTEIANVSQPNTANYQVLPYYERPQTAERLSATPEYMEKLNTIIAWLETRMFAKPRYKDRVFSQQLVKRQFNQRVRGLIKAEVGDLFDENNPNHFFDVDQWFVDRRGPLPPAIAHWDPESLEPMPEWPGLNTNWLEILTALELKTPGFVNIFAHHIDQERDLVQKMAQFRKEMSNPMGLNSGFH